MHKNSGNALFLILIAVALFAALSYAVTQSGRGGGNVDREQGELLAARLISQFGDYQQHIMRLKLTGGYEQVHFDDSAPTSAGTCYNGAITQTPCRTIGLFHPESGMAKPAGQPDGHWRHWQATMMPLSAEGVEIGTLAPDLYFYVAPVTLETCRALNRRLNGSSDILRKGVTRSGTGMGFSSFSYDRETDTFSSSATANFPGFDYEAESGCMGDASEYYDLFYTTVVQ